MRPVVKILRGQLAWLMFPMLALAVYAQPVPEGGPPRDEAGARRLVELKRVVPDVHLEVRYATSHNFMKRKLYPAPRIFVRQEVADALARVQKRVEQHGCSLLVFDGYRPWGITKAMWDQTPAAQRGFVANPSKGSKHNRGGAVDLSLCSLATGRALPMPSGYDEFSPRARFDYPGGSALERRNRAFLRQCMEAEGFQVLPHEWWHFDYKGWKEFPLLDYSFTELDALTR